VPKRKRAAKQHEPRTPAPKHSPADRPSRRQRVVTADWLAEATRDTTARLRRAARLPTQSRTPPHPITVAAGTAATSSHAESSTTVRILVVVHETTATPPLIEAVRARAARGSCTFTLLVPSAAHGLHRLVDAEDQETGEAQRTLAEALPLLEQAAGAPVVGMVGDPTALTAVEDAVNAHGFDELILATRPAHLTRWLRLDLPSKMAGLGLPITTVNP